jgi:iron complex transport system ATP-binding protein
MSGLHTPHAGEIRLEGVALRHLSSRRRARAVAFLPQQMPGDLDLRVHDVVLMGRFPHRSIGLFESAADHRIAEAAMAMTDTLPFADRPLATLSGGERQRVHVAAALAQQPRVLLLDEPTASLDLQHQLAVFDILRTRARQDALAVVVVTHDINHAAHFCTNVLLLHEGRVVASGTPSEVLTPERLAVVYSVKLAALSLPGRPERRWFVPIGAADRTLSGTKA